MWIFIFRWMNRKSSELIGNMERELALSGENVLLGPVAGIYRGATGNFDVVKGNAVIALTDKHLIIRKLIGGTVEIPLSDIADVTKNKWFKASYYNGQEHIIIETTKNAKIGFMVPSTNAWMDQIASLIQPKT